MASAERARRPNIVFVLVDDLRWDALGYAGHPFVKTPHIDRIAREGAIFENAFVTTPLCSRPGAAFSRASMCGRTAYGATATTRSAATKW